MPITSTIQQGTLSLAAVTPGNSAIGDAAAAGTSASVARADHKHGREASGTPGASAVGDTAATGSATTVALSDHRHSREAFGTPVNIDASITSLSAGSLTTVARADHVHTVSSAAIVIGRSALTSSASSITFSSISSSYHTLWLYISAKTTTAAILGYVDVRFNNDTSANYLEQSNGTNNSATFCGVGYMHGTTNTLSASGAISETLIYNANSTSQYKTLSTKYTYNNGSSGTLSNSWAGFGFTQWRSTAAISTITILSRFGDLFDSGTTATLYGLR